MVDIKTKNSKIVKFPLKEIYEPAGIHWEVTEEPDYAYSGETLFFKEQSGLLNSYTPAMREMNKHFHETREVDPAANYIFILKHSGKEKVNRDAAGFMPRGGQFGYIFTRDFQSDAEILQTIAHELGHRRLLLKHIGEHLRKMVLYLLKENSNIKYNQYDT